MRLVFTQSALRDLDRLRQFLHVKNPRAAERYGKRLHKILLLLTEQPALGHPLEEFPDIREIVADDYIARYLLRDQEIVILRIWHGKEDR